MRLGLGSLPEAARPSRAAAEVDRPPRLAEATAPPLLPPAKDVAMALAAWRVSTRTRAADAILMRKVRTTTLVLVLESEVPSLLPPNADQRARSRCEEKVSVAVVPSS